MKKSIVTRVKIMCMATVLIVETAFGGFVPVSAKSVSGNDIALERNATLPCGGTDGDITWSIDEAGHLIVTGTGDYKLEPDWLTYSDAIKTASVSVSGIKYIDRMFYGCTNLERVDLSKLNTCDVVYMSSMFFGCSNLQSLDLSNFDTSKVTRMQSMFSGCKSLQSLNVSKFDTSSVKSMSSMFSQCNSLTSLDLGSFDTANVESMSSMFYGCSNLTELDLSGFKTGSVTNMSRMFSSCSELESLDVSNFDTSNVTDMSYMFSGCKSLASLNVSGFDTGKVERMATMFSNCSELESLDLSSFDTSSVTDMSCMFMSTDFEELDLSSFDTSSVTDVSYMFSSFRCPAVDLSGFNLSKASNMEEFFGNSRRTYKIIFPNLPMEVELQGDWVDENEVPVTAAKANLGRNATYYRQVYIETECYKKGHQYGAPTFTWDGLSSATAVFFCTNSSCYVGYRKVVEAVVTEKITPATTEKEGNIAYTAVAEMQGKTYANIKNVAIPKLEKEPQQEQTKPVAEAVGTVFEYSGAKYKVTQDSAMSETVEYVSLVGKKAKNVSVPATVTVEGITYKVTAIAKNAFKNNKKLTGVTIGKNVTKIGAKAFYGCKKLKKIVIKSKELKSVGKNAIRGIHKNAKIDVPNSKKKKYKKLFKTKTGYQKTMKVQ